MSLIGDQLHRQLLVFILQHPIKQLVNIGLPVETLSMWEFLILNMQQ